MKRKNFFMQWHFMVPGFMSGCSEAKPDKDVMPNISFYPGR